jgi:O-antigen ligase
VGANISPAQAHHAVGTRGQRTVNARHSDSFRLARAYVIVVLAAAVDVTNFLDRGNSLRYALLFVPFASFFWIRLAHPSMVFRRPARTDKILFLIVALGLTGTYYGILFNHTTATARPLFLPMLIAFLYLGTSEELAEREARMILRALAGVGAAYICLAALANSGLIAWFLQFRQFKNVSFPFGAIGLAGAFILKRPGRVIGLIILAGLAFLGYPSATAALILVGTIITFFITSPRGTRFRGYLVAILVVTIGGISLANFSSSVALTSSYFELVGKRNTDAVRLAIWTNGIDEFKQSPLIGSAFASDTITEVGPTRASPYHNDFVLFLAKGGLLGLLLLLAFLFALERSLLRRYFALTEVGEDTRASLVRLLLVGFNGFLVSMAFNPVLQGFSRSATIFAMYGIAMLVGTPRRVRRPNLGAGPNLLPGSGARPTI